MARGPAPPGVPTPICRIEIVRAAISPSLRAKSRRETYFRKNSPTRTGRTFLGSTSCRSYVTLSSAMSVVASCASVSERIHSSSSNCFGVGSFSFFRNISCVLSRKRHSSSKSPKANLIVRMARPRNKRHLQPAPAKETMASRCSCLSLPHRAPRWFVSPSSPGDSGRLGTLPSGPMPELRGMRAVVQFPRHPADQSLHGFADGTSGCHGTCSLPALFVCLRLRLPCYSARRPRALPTRNFGDQITDLSRFPQVASLFQLGVPVDTFRNLSQEQVT